jgi:hypothetical protein
VNLEPTEVAVRLRILVPALLVSVGSLDTADLCAQTTQESRLVSLPVSFRSSTSAAAQGSSSFGGRVVTAVAGAALGAGVGFFASQVFKGDWEEEPGRPVPRPVWAAVGGSVGFAMGFSFPLRGGAHAPLAARAEISDARSVIAAEEIGGKGVKTAYEAVRMLRPEWLITRGTHALDEGPQDRIQTYLDGVHLGAEAALNDVAAENIQSLHLLDAAKAAYRWGAGHSHGAIMIVSKGGLSR